MTANLTLRQANVALAFLASSGSFVTATGIARGLNLPIPDVVPSIAAVAHHLRAERHQQAFLEHRQGFGYVLFGTGPRLAALEKECRAIVNAVKRADAGDCAADAIMRRIGVRATPSCMLGMGA
jgi:hypothetical protein